MTEVQTFKEFALSRLGEPLEKREDYPHDSFAWRYPGGVFAVSGKEMKMNTKPQAMLKLFQRRQQNMRHVEWGDRA